jgi:hypothetical protein
MRQRTYRNLVSAAVVVAGVVAAPVAAPAHQFPSTRWVVVQVDSDRITLLVGYQPGTTAADVAMLANVARTPERLQSRALRSLMQSRAIAPIGLRIDDVAATPRSIETKIFVDPPGSDRLAVAVLVTYDLPPREAQVAIDLADDKARISWVDRTTCARATWKQRSWIRGMASVLLTVDGPCADRQVPPPVLPSSSSSSRRRRAIASSTRTPSTTASRPSSE